MPKSKILFLLPVFITFCVFLNAIPNGFVYDDISVIEENYFIKSFHNIPKLFSKEYFQLSNELSYRPFVSFSYFIDYAVWGLNPPGYHLSNVVIHAFNTVLLYLLLNYILKSRFISLFSAILFAIHPCVTEAVNSVSYREDLLVVCFSFLSCLFLIMSGNRYPTKQDTLQTDSVTDFRKRFSFIFALLFYMFALFSKESAIVLPLFIVLYLALCRQKHFVFVGTTKSIQQNSLKMCFAKTLTGYALVTLFFLLVRFVLMKNPKLVSVTYYEKSFLISSMTMVKVLAYYLKLMFFPVPLNADYKMTPVWSLADISFLVSIFLLAATGVIIFKIVRKYRIQGVFALCFFVALLPVMNIVPIGHIMAERYLYFPIAGFCAVVGCTLGFWVSGNIQQNQRGDASVPGNQVLKKRVCFVFFSSILFISLITGTVARNNDWRNEYTFWSKILRNQPMNHDAHNNLGVFYYKQGNLDRAIWELEEAIALKRNYPEALNGLGTMYIDKGWIDKAIYKYSEAIKHKPFFPQAYYNLGNAYVKKGLIEVSIAFFKKAIDMGIYSPQVFNNLGSAYLKKGMVDDAIVQYRKALEVYNGFAEAHSNLGFVYTETNQPEKAMNELKQALRLQPDHANAHNNLGALYCRQELWDLAEIEFLNSIKANPKNMGAHKNLGIIYFQQGQKQKAREHFLQVLKDDINHIKEPGVFQIASQLGLIKIQENNE
ncbi:MAG: tetratricopeptide repeat protein [Candidatus Kuenenia sp.]|nr:tetratricopeptide repeat protein [Candidatus Kuenenia hertensis]